MSVAVPKGYKKTKLGYIPKEWEIDSLSKVLKPIVREVEKPKEPYWRLGLRSHGKGAFHEFVEDPNSVSMDKLYVVEKDDLIVNITFAWEHAITLATKKDENKLVSHRFPTYQFKNNNSPLFYKYYVLQPRFKYELENISPGGAGRNRVMSKTDFLKIDVLIPTFKEQHKIANILGCYDEAIVRQSELIREKEELKKGLIQKLLSGEVRFDGFSDEWKNVKLGKVAKFYKGKGISKDDLSPNGLPCILYGELYTTYGEKIDKVISKTNINVNELFLSKKNDIIIPASGETAIDIATASCVIHENIALGGDLNVIRTDNNGIFLSYYLNVIAKHRIASLAQGVSVVHLYSSQLENILISIPSTQEQEKIAEVLSLSDHEINLLKNELDELKLQKKALMQKLLTGQVRVRV